MFTETRQNRVGIESTQRVSMATPRAGRASGTGTADQALSGHVRFPCRCPGALCKTTGAEE